jgi:DNA helicase II / ATP-dependent DNA helicase PcrA
MSVRWQHIRTAAARVRDRYREEAGTPAGLPLPIEDVVEQVYLLSAFDDPSLDPRINGELNAGVGSIRLRVDMDEARRRFVIAHELGHYVLEALNEGLYEDDDSTLVDRGADLNGEPGGVQAYNTRERHEQEANLFALELLVPADLLWQAVQQPEWTVEALAQVFGVSHDAMRAQLVNICCLEPVRPAAPLATSGGSFEPDADQQAAVEAALPTLVVAGPGTGKTRTIVAKYLQLVNDHVDPATILALTFSNKAAEEMRERIIAALRPRHPQLLGRVEVSTFHSWGLNFLKQYGHQLGLPATIQLRATADLYVLLRRRLADLPLQAYKDLRDPGMYLRQIIEAISRAKDELRDPAAYQALTEAEAARLVAEVERATAGKTTKKAQKERDDATRDAARLRELGLIYARYEEILREEGVLDYGDLVMRAVEALRLPLVAAATQARYQYILVDEFQDINYASGELVRLLDGGRGRVWAVGDPWQSIYRFRGASPANLQQFKAIYAGASLSPLRLNYRSGQQILDGSHAVMVPDPLFGEREGLQAWRGNTAQVREWACADSNAEAAAIAHDILRRVRRRALPICARPARGSVRRIGRPSLRPRRARLRFADHAILCRTHVQVTALVAALAAHGIPVDQAGRLLDIPEVKDTLAVLAMVGVSSSAGTLRALTVPEHALAEADMLLLVQEAHAHKLALPRAARNEEICLRLSPEGWARLRVLHQIVDDLTEAGDAWQALTRYLFEHSQAMRAQIAAAAHGGFAARRSLAALGQLVSLARSFVRQALPHEQRPSDFIAYLRLLIEAGEQPKAVIPAEQADVVQVMTIHAAKGLEFPCVYVPGVQDGVFPARGRSGSIPELPGLAHGAPPDAMQEERYLLYVALTRARDRLVISRATQRGDKPIDRSPLLPAGAGGLASPWPVIARGAARACNEAHPTLRLGKAPVMRVPIPATSLDTYDRCPRQYLFQYGYQLFDDLSPYLRMHQTIQDVVQELAKRARSGVLPPDEAALRELTWQVFATHELEGVLYQNDYFAEALRHISQVWQDFGNNADAANAVNQHFVVRRPGGELMVRVDRVEEGERGPLWVRTRSGRARDDDHLSRQVMLYALAARQEHGEQVEIALHYTATGLLRPATPKPEVLERHAAEIDALLTGIQAGRWEPNPGSHCATCPFNLICPT